MKESRGIHVQSYGGVLQIIQICPVTIERLHDTFLLAATSSSCNFINEGRGIAKLITLRSERGEASSVCDVVEMSRMRPLSEKQKVGKGQNKTMSLTTKNIVAVTLGVAMVLVASFGLATPAKAQTIADLQAMINSLLSQIQALQSSQGGGMTGGTCNTFTQNHQQGDQGGEVMWIQQFLNKNGHQIAASGAGSPGNETAYFGALSKAAVAKFQAANGIAPAAGYWGPITRAKANTMCTPTTGGGGSTPVTGNGLKVMLATGSPNNVALVQGQGIAELSRYTFSNPTGSEITVTSLGFNRIGASTDAALDNVYLYQGVTRLTDPAGISSSAFSFNNPSGIFKVPAGGSITVSVRADIDAAANGQQVGASLVSVGTSGVLDSSVVFPVMGGIQTISSASIASVSWSSVTPSGGTFAPQNDTTVFLSTLTVSNRAVWLNSVQFENRGGSSDDDFQNLRLYVKGTQVGNAGTLMGDKIVFDLSGAPLKLMTGGNEIKLVADIVGGSGETFDFQIRRGIDINLVDSELNQPLAPAAPTAVTAPTIEGVGLSVVKAATSPTSNVAVGATNVLWGKFEFRASGDNLKVEELGIDVDQTAGAGMDNVRIMLDGVQVGSTNDVADTGTSISLGSSMILKAGTTHVVEIYGDAKTAAGTNFANASTVLVEVFVDNDDTEGMSSGDRLTSDVGTNLGDGVDANTVTVSSSSLAGTKFSGYGNQTVVAGANNARVGSFTLSTGSTEGVNVNTIVVDFSSAVGSTLTDLRLVDNSTGTQIGSTKTSVNTSNTFSVNLALGASQTKTIDVYANVQSGAGAGSLGGGVVLDSTTGGTGATTGQSVSIGSDVTLQTITIGSGTLTVSRDAGTPVNSNVIAGATMVHVGKFNFDGANSSYTVQELKVKIPADAATSVSNVTLKYKNSAGVEQTASQALSLSSGDQPYATATFTGLSFYVPLNDSSDVDVYVDIPTTTSGAKSGAAISAVLDANEGFKAIDSAGTSDTTLASADVTSVTTGYGTKYVKKSIPTLARLTTGYTANTVASGIGLFRFTVTADAAGAVEWREISFSITSSGVTTSDWTLYDVTGSAIAVNTTASNVVGGGPVIICPDVNCGSGNTVEQIGAGSSKTYELRAGTVTGWGNSGDTLTLNFADDTSAVVNNTAENLHAGQNMVWSDRSATSHTTATTDWTNGYLVKDMDSDTRSCQFGSATTCTP